MKIIKPFVMSDISLISSTVTETDYGDWAAGTTYALGDIKQVISPSYNITISNSASTGLPALVTMTEHGYEDNTMFKLVTTGTLPGGLLTTMIYYMVQVDLNTFKISDKKNGTPLLTTSAGSGTHSVVISSHKVYESLVAGNVGNVPHKSPNQWLDLGTTNRWKCFDGSMTSQTECKDSMSYVIQAKGRVNSVGLMNIDAAEVVISARVAGQAVGATTNATGYPIGTSTIALASAGTGLIDIGDIIMFAGQSTQYTTTTSDADVSNGGTISFTPPLVEAIPASATAISVNVYGPTTYGLISPLNVISYWSWYWEPIVRANSFVDMDFPPYNNLVITITLNNVGNTVKCGAMAVGSSTKIGGTQYGASISLNDYSVKKTDDFGNKVVQERAFSSIGDFQIYVDRVGVDGVTQFLESIRATPCIFVGSESYENTIIFGYYQNMNMIISNPSFSILNVKVEGLT